MLCKLFILILWISTITLRLIPSIQANPLVERPQLQLGVGEQRMIPADKMVRFSAGGSAIRATRLNLPKRIQVLLVKAVKRGFSDLMIWTSDGSVQRWRFQVRKPSANKTSPGLLQAMSSLQEVETVFLGKEVLIRGEVSLISEARRISDLAENFPEKVKLRVHPHPEFLKKSVQKLETALDTYPSLRIKQIGNEVWIKGEVQHSQTAEALKKTLRNIYPLARFDLQSPPDAAATIFFQVRLIELSKEAFQKIGLQWPALLENGVAITPFRAKTALQWDTALHHLASNGDAKILSEPELVLRSPGEAELFSGGEFPVRNTSRFQSNVKWKPYGLTLKLKSTHQSGRRVRLELQTEVSHLDFTLPTGDLPALKKNRLSTQIDATFGRPLFLCGLLQENIQEHVEGLPFLKDIPVLGLLFGSEKFIRRESELVIVLTPHRQIPSSRDRLFGEEVPEGWIPPPRNWIPISRYELLKQSPDFPWNIFNDPI